MSGRYQLLDSDEQRLPEGMTRVAYDADAQQYTFRDNDGSLWYSEEGNRYGRLHRDPETALRSSTSVPQSVRNQDWRLMAPWFLIVIVVLMAVFWFVNSGGRASIRCVDGMEEYSVRKRDTCWLIADEHGTTVDALTTANPKLSCEGLMPTQMICSPRKEDSYR
ncbi:hypothetical protein AC579_1558 [Pseudocercospora musae]|uniref:LysM domain-containing protein n=1 Tax=Pseudocercospora musae TaxID=113226 RepID=A0A139ILQ6_9PEZI|nr:hypothetical protein AC579_1558 [Pseudocercospora musae]